MLFRSTVVWLYRSLIRPLNVLRMATANMKQGNLDFTISGNPDDELGQLCEEFEEEIDKNDINTVFKVLDREVRNNKGGY